MPASQINMTVTIGDPSRFQEKEEGTEEREEEREKENKEYLSASKSGSFFKNSLNNISCLKSLVSVPFFASTHAVVADLRSVHVPPAPVLLLLQFLQFLQLLLRQFRLFRFR